MLAAKCFKVLTNHFNQTTIVPNYIKVAGYALPSNTHVGAWESSKDIHVASCEKKNAAWGVS